MFTIERGLTDEELEGLREKAQAVFDNGDGKEAAKAYNIGTSGRNPIFVLESLVRADRHNKDFPLTEVWPNVVRMYLNSEGWEIGYGFVGKVE